MEKAAKELAIKFSPFNEIIDYFGVPPLWDRPPGFATLLYIILEQQVSLASAKATFEKLSDTLSAIEPDNFLGLSDIQLKGIGFSRQKIKYGRILARAIIEGDINLNGLLKMPDKRVKEILMSIKGIGHWTSDIYLLMVLLRPDIWPHGDRALAVAVFEIFKLKEIPTYDQSRQMASSWKPWRSVAARLLWHHYLSTPRKRY